VRDAFTRMGHNAWSCDIEPTRKEGKHIKADVREILDWDYWDLVIAHPPCEHLASSGARWFTEKRADGRQAQAIEFFMLFTRLSCPFAIENPVGIMSTLYRRPDQIIQPWMFGHGETKATCLWLQGLAPLKPTDIVDGREARIWRMSPSDDRKEKRSETYTGIAKAMAEQWGKS